MAQIISSANGNAHQKTVLGSVRALYMPELNLCIRGGKRRTVEMADMALMKVLIRTLLLLPR